MSSRLNSHWTSHLSSAEDKKEMESRVIEARFILERLDDVVKRKMEASIKEMRKTSNFSDASWTHEMANELGYQRALEELLTIIRIK